MTHALSDSSERAASGLGGGRALWAALTLTWLCSVGSAISTSGVYFVASSRYAFDSEKNLWLALVYGLTYIVGAGSCGWLLRRVAGPGHRLTPRGLLAGMMVAMAAVCSLPLVAQQEWALWVFVGIYSPLSGWQWPLVERYLASGRSGRSLRHAMALFNLSWASAVMVGMWLMAPLVEAQPLWVIAGQGVVHIICVPIVCMMEPRPRDHGEPSVEDGVEDPDKARRLLMTFRGLLVTSFVLYSALTPQLPQRFTGFEVPEAWQTPMTSIWMACRVAVFGLLGVWHGWHGRWRTVWWSGGALVAGFCLAMFGPNLPTMIAGLALFGIGFGGAYSAAIYYAMVVGSSDVDAGGKHEAIIGVGYTIGPAAALVVRALEQRAT